LESLGYELFLCKKEDFAPFGKKPKKYEFEFGFRRCAGRKLTPLLKGNSLKKA
jgi:hypothetical protein